VALKRLRLRLALEIRTMPESLEPTRLWQARTHARQLKVSVDHDDYPALVAEALNQLQVANWEMARVAGTLGVSTSQFTKLFRRMPSAWVALNFCRTTHGLPPLK
jgi:AraC-like DNA-binding protein